MNEGKLPQNISDQEQFNSDEIDLLEYWHIIKKYKKLIGIIVGVSVIIAVIVSLISTKIYRSSVTIMPVGGGGSGLGGMASQLAGLPFVGGSIGGLVGGAQTPSQKLMALLETNTLAENVIRELNLKKVLFSDRAESIEDSPLPMGKVIESLKSIIEIEEDVEQGTITVTAYFKEPELAAKLANTYVSNLQDFINQNEFTVSKRHRIFVEEQLKQNKEDLLRVGKELNEFYREGRVSALRSKLDVNLDSEWLEHDIKNAGEDFVIDKVWETIEKRKKKIKSKIKKARVVKDVPQQVYLRYLTLRKELLGKLNALLTQQFEMAKIEEAKEELAFQVIDPARVPYQRYKPKRGLIVMITFVSSLFAAIFIAFFIEYIKRMKKRSSHYSSS